MTGQTQPTGRALTVLNEMVRAGVDRGVALSEVTRMGLPGAPAPAVTAEQQAQIDALPAAARALYEGWREAGHSPAAALQEVRASGVGAVTEAQFDVHLGRVFGRISESDATAQLAKLEQDPGRKAGLLSEVAYDRTSAEVFDRPGRRA